MRFSSFSLRASIIAQLSFLIVAAMLLCDVVMIRFAERDLIRARIDAGRLLARALEGRLAARGLDTHGLSNGDRDAFSADVEELLAQYGFDSALVTARRGRVIAEVGVDPEQKGSTFQAALRAATTGMEEVELQGRIWAVIWFGPESFRVSVPARTEGKNMAGISVLGGFGPIYESLRASQKLVLLYILLDTVILALAGMVLLSRIVVRPIRELLKMTEAYKGGDFLVPLEATSGSEIRRLSRSLSHMLRRLDENKEAMRQHIDSLEQANAELRQAQNEIIRSEKLASVGRLAAGIAHEIGNPIGIILGYLDLIRRKDISEPERADFLQRVEVEITRINETIRTLLDFSRASENKPELLPVHTLIRNTLEMLRPQPIMEHIRVDLALEAEEDGVFGDPGRLQQVLLNVLMNAGDALAEEGPAEPGEAGGVIRIETRSDEEGVEVKISDNGPGIAADELSKVFDPFYTTKDPGKGTGLGLSVSHRIIEDMGGTVRVSSDPGRGTEVIVRLPLRKAEENPT